MTSAAKTNNRGGFTLLEIVLVISVSALLVGGAISMMLISSSERKLKHAAADVEVFAKRARSISQLQQKPYALEFLPGQVRLLPFAETAGDQVRMPSGRLVGGRRSEEPPAAGTVAPVHDTLELDADLVLSVRRWASDAWLKPDERHPQVWRFDPDGLCEPIGVRLALDGSWIEQEFHPLTASVRDFSSEIR